MNSLIKRLQYIIYFAPSYPVRLAFYGNGPHLVLNYQQERYESRLEFTRWRIVDHQKKQITYFSNPSKALDFLRGEGISEDTLINRVNHKFYETVAFTHAGSVVALDEFGDEIQEQAKEYSIRLNAAFDKLTESSVEGTPHVAEVLELLDVGIPYHFDQEYKLHVVKETEDDDRS